MVELFKHPEQIPVWDEATDGAAVDWDALLAGYHSIVDWPGCHFWRELTHRYPGAKVILTVGTPRLVPQRLGHDLPRHAGASPRTIPSSRRSGGCRKMILQQTFGGSTADPELAQGVLEMHNEEVRRTVPDDRLLVYEVKSGWGPLCAFLGVAEPEAPFPRANSTEEFLARA